MSTPLQGNINKIRLHLTFCEREKVKKFTIIAGARPNFMKIAPVIRALNAKANLCRWRLVHTGQHYDRAMNEVFFEELGIPNPDISLECGGGSHAEQTAKIMVAFERELINNPADYVIVVGDVNSTLACSIVAKKLNTKVAHIEAGLRSGDHSMPEEINRIVTDSISDILFVTEPSGKTNLLCEGKNENKIYEVGHVMIDNLLYQKEKLQSTTEAMFPIDIIAKDFREKHGGYGVVTLHRPSNVDNESSLRRVASTINPISKQIPLIFPVHPRTEQNIEKFKIKLSENIHTTPPLPYMEFLSLWSNSKFVLTDSGGLQEETTALGVPCVTVRDNTERPITVEEGTNTLAGTDPEKVISAVKRILDGTSKQGRRPALWDGKSAHRIVDILLRN